MTRSLFTMVTVFACLSAPAMALDTTEGFDKGLTDVEYSLSSGGMGLKAAERSLEQTLTLGAGLPANLSVAGSVTMGSDGNLENGAHSVEAMLLHSTVDTEHFDLDLMLTTGHDGDLSIAPGFEINLDKANDLAAFGFFAGVAFPIFAQDGEKTFDIEVAPGVYYTINEDQQILLGFDFTYHKDAEEGGRDVDLGSVALGYNVNIADGLELITEVGVDIPQDDEDVSFSASIGLVATLPSPK